MDELITISRRKTELFLKQYRILLQKEKSLQRAICEAKMRTTDISVHLKDNMTSGGSGPYDPIAENLVKAIDTVADLQTLAQKTHNTLQAIIQAIHAAPTETQRTILVMRYIEGQSWNMIQRRIHYEYRNTMYQHSKALSSVGHWMSENNIQID